MISCVDKLGIAMVLEFFNNLWGLGTGLSYRSVRLHAEAGGPVLEFLNNLWGLGTE